MGNDLRVLPNMMVVNLDRLVVAEQSALKLVSKPHVITDKGKRKSLYSSRSLMVEYSGQFEGIKDTVELGTFAVALPDTAVVPLEEAAEWEDLETTIQDKIQKRVKKLRKLYKAAEAGSSMPGTSPQAGTQLSDAALAGMGEASVDTAAIEATEAWLMDKAFEETEADLESLDNLVDDETIALTAEQLVEVKSAIQDATYALLGYSPEPANPNPVESWLNSIQGDESVELHDDAAEDAQTIEVPPPAFNPQ